MFTRKVATDVSYLACAKVLLEATRRHLSGVCDAQCQYHRRDKGTWPSARRSNSSGCTGWASRNIEELAKLEAAMGDPPTPVRIYAPVGSHKELLAYLVRRLLENGANSSFVNRIADEHVSLDELVRDPVAELAALEPKRNPAIPLPRDIFGAAASQ